MRPPVLAVGPERARLSAEARFETGQGSQAVTARFELRVSHLTKAAVPDTTIWEASWSLWMYRRRLRKCSWRWSYLRVARRTDGAAEPPGQFDEMATIRPNGRALRNTGVGYVIIPRPVQDPGQTAARP